MNILHYTLGLPPYRSGGLTKYATDLALFQETNHNNVSILYAGSIDIKYPYTSIKRDKPWHNITIHQIKNPVVIPLLYGVKNPLSLIGGKYLMDQQQMEKLYNQTRPQIFHIHTLMGLPYELVKFLKNKGTKIIFSSHDYYGLCLKVNFINKQGELCSSPNGLNCATCNYDAPPNLFLRLRNSKLLLGIKDQLSCTNIREVANTKNIMFPSNQKKINIPLAKKRGYEALIDYYNKIFTLMNHIHFNSEVTRSVYSQYIDTSKSKVISISHSGIKDNRLLKLFDAKQIRLTFVGSSDIYKGLPLLKEVLAHLPKQGISNWILNVWGGNVSEDKDCFKIKYRGKYSSNQLKDVLAETDLLIVPSLWKETFSLITLEALSYGVPVLVSSNVGAKDIVCRYDSKFIYETENDLQNILCLILQDISLLERYNKKIVDLSWKYSFQQHVNEISNLYNEVINENSIH